MSAAAGPSRLPPAPSTSGDSESTSAPTAARTGPDVGVLRELGKQALVEALNEVRALRGSADRRSKAPRRLCWTQLWPAHWDW